MHAAYLLLNNFMKKIILLSVLVITTTLVNAQTIGNVVGQDSLPIANVNVLLVEQNIMINTDQFGAFFIDEKIPSNSYIQIYKEGYSSQVHQFKKNVNLKVVLEKLHIDIDEVGVVESFYQLGNNKLVNIEKRSVDEDFTTFNSLVENVSQISGVDLISSGLGIQKIVVRGLSGMRVVTYLNGMKIENQQWANDHGVGFTSLGINEVELIKGSSALQYGGEAVGGLLFFKDKPFVSEEKPKVFIATKFNNSNLMSANQFGLRLSKNSFHFNLYGNYTISSDYRLPNKTYLFNSRFRNNAIKFSIAKRFNRWQNIFRYQYNGEQTGIPAHSHSKPEFVNIADITLNTILASEDFKLTRPTQFVENHLFIHESNYIKKAHKLSLHLGHYINNLQEYEKWTAPAFDMTLSNTQFNPNYRYQKGGFTLNVGSQISHLKNSNNIQSRLIPDASTNNIGLYSVLDIEKDNYGFNIGFRLDHKQIECEAEQYNKQFFNSSYSSGLYANLDNHIFRITYSSAFRAPHFAELFSNGIHHGTAMYEIGDKELDIEKGHQFDLKYQFSNDHFGFVLNPFMQYINNFITVNASDSFYNNNYRIYHYTQFSKVQLAGVEMNVHYHPHMLHNLHFEQSYSFLQNTNEENEFGLALTPSNKIRTRAIFYFDKLKKGADRTLQNVSLTHLISLQKNDVAEREMSTSAYNIFNLQLHFKFLSRIDCSLSVDNFLNEEYTPHISRLRDVAGGIPNPGRSFNVSFKYEF